MKKFLFILLLLMVPAVSCIAGTFSCKNVTIEALRNQVPIPSATIISKRDVNGLCEVILNINNEYVPVYAGADYVIAGEMFQGQKQITQTEIDNLKAKNFKRLLPKIDQYVSMVYKPKVINQTVYMITDPVCPFCHRAEENLKLFSKKYHAEFKLILYSVHPPIGRQKAVEAVCRKLTASQYIAGKWKEDNKTSQYQCQTGINKIFQIEQLMSKLGINGVPMFIFPDGKTVKGADMTNLKKALAINLKNAQKAKTEKISLAR